MLPISPPIHAHNHTAVEEAEEARMPQEVTILGLDDYGASAFAALLSNNSMSRYLMDAERNSGTCVLERIYLQCDNSGLEFSFEKYDIAIKIPEGALAVGKTISIEVAVMPMYGPFQFPRGVRLISPVLWLCLLDQNVQLKRPFRITLPHILSGLTEKKAQYYQVDFYKASHRDYASGMYHFHPTEGSIRLFSEGGQNYGTLNTYHFCYICITAKNNPELNMDAGYCLTRVGLHVSQWRDEIYFCVSYYLKYCLQVMQWFTGSI
jgi:hypothetical protein